MHRRLADERNRASATITEVLERSAELSAVADRVSSSSVDRLAMAEVAFADLEKLAASELEELLAAAEERARLAAIREAALEGTIADLRSTHATARAQQ